MRRLQTWGENSQPSSDLCSRCSTQNTAPSRSNTPISFKKNPPSHRRHRRDHHHHHSSSPRVWCLAPEPGVCICICLYSCNWSHACSHIRFKLLCVLQLQVRVLNVTCLQTRWSEVRAREVAEQPTKTPEPSGVNGDPDGPQLELGLNRAVLGEVSQRREAVNFWRDSVAMREIVSIQGGEPPLPRPTKPT